MNKERILALLSVVVLSGCAGTASDRSGPTGDTTTRMERPASAPLLVNGRPIGWDVLTPLLSEAAGAAVAEEAALDALLARELQRRGVELTAEQIDAERDRFSMSLGSASPALLEQLRRRRGLGPVRFDALLRRNAALRLLTAGRAEVTEEDVRLAHAVTHGPRVVARVVTRATRAEAAQERELVAGASRESFAEAARARSIDPTAAAGGWLDPISLADPAYPGAVRAVLSELQVGAVSEVVALDEGYAVFYLERRMPADGVSLEDARPRLTARLRERKERVEMERFARELLSRADISVLDPSLGWAADR
ncbi:MAG: peptidylprolyl isomerase [Planctomycetota bacterium]